MKSRLACHVLLALLAVGAASGASSGFAVELTAKGISIPFFNEAGKLTHRLTAEQGTLIGPQQHLEGVDLVYFSATDPKQVVRRLRAAEATWDQTKEVLTGRGAIHVETQDSELSGEGFNFALNSARLTIERRFKMTNPDAVLTSDQAVVDLIIDRKTEDDVRVRDVKRCEAFGNLHVVIESAARARYRFDEAFSDRAIYDGARHTISLPNEVRLRHDGRDAFTRSLDIVLGKQVARKSGQSPGPEN